MIRKSVFLQSLEGSSRIRVLKLIKIYLTFGKICFHPLLWGKLVSLPLPWNTMTNSFASTVKNVTEIYWKPPNNGEKPAFHSLKSFHSIPSVY